MLLDASNLVGQGNTIQEDTLYQVAASTGARYERRAPEAYKNWHEVIIAERRAQETASAEEARVPDPVPEQDSPQKSEGLRRKGVGR